MPANIIERQYRDPITGDWLNFLRENAMGKVEAFLRYEHEYYVGSGTSNTFTTSGLSVTLQNGNWLDFIAIVAGSVITIEFEDGASSLSYTRTVTDNPNGNVFYIDSQLPSPYNATTFPSGAITGMRISIDAAPASVEFDFNLAQESNPNANSVLDGNKNTFKLDNVDSLALSTPTAMTQIGQFKSGGHMEDVTLELESETGGVRGISRIFKLEYTFYQWGILQSGFPEPDYYPLAPYQRVRNYTVNNNLDGVQSAESPATVGNLAAYDQNFANGSTQYAVSSFQWRDYLGDSISSPDYSNESTFEVVVPATNQSTLSSKYKIALTWRPEDTLRYQDKPDRIGEVLRWVIPDVVFTHSATPDPTVYQGLTDGNERFDLTDIQFFVSPADVTITGKLIPVNMETFWDNIPDGDRKITISSSISDYTLDADSTDRVELKLWDGDIIDAPTLGIQHPYVFNENLLDHAGLNITANTTPNTTTSDDVLYTSRFQLEKNTVYDGVYARIYGFNDITNESFILEEEYFDFSDTSNGVYINGVHEWNKTINRGFLLPVTSDRNIISLNRSQNLDTPTLYGMEIQYGFLSRIESWIANNAVADYFFNNTLLNNGKNQNWQRFTDGDWQLKVGYFPTQNGVSDYQIYTVKTRPFNDDSNFTFSAELKDSAGTVYTGVPINASDPFVKCEVTVTYVEPFLNEWFHLELRNFQGQTIGFISSVLDRDNVNVPNAFEPLTGETKLKVSGTGATRLLECNINSSLIDVNSVQKVTLIPRSYTNIREKETGEYGNGDLIAYGDTNLLDW